MTATRELAAYARQVREKIEKIRAATDEDAAQLQTDLAQYTTQQTQALMAKGVPLTKIQDAVRAAIDTIPQNTEKPKRKSMFKSLKDFIAGSIKEGIDEAKAELAAEKEQKKQHLEETQKLIAAIPEPEKFALAIAAPFRAVYLSGWSPILETNESDGNITYPRALYSFGEKDSLTDEKRKELTELIERDFDIVDAPSALNAIATALQTTAISDKLRQYAAPDAIEASESINDMLQSTSQTAGLVKKLRADRALAACMAAHAISASADCGYMEKTRALDLLADVADFVKKEYTSWKDFGDEFLRGERESELNNALGRRMLAKYTSYLHTKPGSPWRTISWPKNG